MTDKMKLILGDCLEKMKEIPSGGVDAVITDPPYELGFMGKSWDSTGIANNREMWGECLRVLKPGGYLLAFSGTRTYHRMASAIEDAGFEVRDMIEWVYGSGFPKSLNIGKVTDKFIRVGNASWNGIGDSSNGALGYSKLQYQQDYRPKDYSNRHQGKNEIIEERAKQWEGWGTALKPAHEPICMARKPLAEKTVVENCLKYGTGGINIDESRVISYTTAYNGGDSEERTGRFPANLIHDNSKEVKECFPETGKSTGGRIGNKGSALNMMGQEYEAGDPGYGDSGSASRFFKSIIYQAKASKNERNKGLEDLETKQSVGGGGGIGSYLNDVNSASGKFGSEKAPAKNNHPTVKPIALMEYLIKMVSRDNAIVLDPFMGSGTTGVACTKLNRDFIGIEVDPTYYEIAVNRINILKGNK